MATTTLAPSESTPAKHLPAAGPLLDLQAQFAGIRQEVLDAVTRVLSSQHFILGPEVDAFERELAAYVGAKFAVGCGSGSDALALSMMALGVGSGDEVITTPFTFGATAGAIVRLQATPVFVDIDPKTFNIDVRQLEAAVTTRSRVIMPVHLFGLPANMDEILDLAQRHSVAIVEDAAQAIGAQWKGRSVGTLGTFGCFSFFPSKNLGGAGDGGMITTNDAEFAQRLRILRVHGARSKYRYELAGINSRLDAIQAAILRVKLRHLDKWAAARQTNALNYAMLFAETRLTDEVVLPSCPETSLHVYNQYTIRARSRDQLQKFLAAEGVATEVYYPGPLHLEPAFQFLGYGPGDFPHAEAACREVLSLPIYPELTADRQHAIVDAIARFYNR